MADVIQGSCAEVRSMKEGAATTWSIPAILLKMYIQYVFGDLEISIQYKTLPILVLYSWSWPVKMMQSIEDLFFQNMYQMIISDNIPLYSPLDLDSCVSSLCEFVTRTSRGRSMLPFNSDDF